MKLSSNKSLVLYWFQAHAFSLSFGALCSNLLRDNEMLLHNRRKKLREITFPFRTLGRNTMATDTKILNFAIFMQIMSPFVI